MFYLKFTLRSSLLLTLQLQCDSAGGGDGPLRDESGVRRKSHDDVPSPQGYQGNCAQVSHVGSQAQESKIISYWH